MEQDKATVLAVRLAIGGDEDEPRRMYWNYEYDEDGVMVNLGRDLEMRDESSDVVSGLG